MESALDGRGDGQAVAGRDGNPHMLGQGDTRITKDRSEGPQAHDAGTGLLGDLHRLDEPALNVLGPAIHDDPSGQGAGDEPALGLGSCGRPDARDVRDHPGGHALRHPLHDARWQHARDRVLACHVGSVQRVDHKGETVHSDAASRSVSTAWRQAVPARGDGWGEKRV